MTPQFSQNLVTSFALWTDNRLAGAHGYVNHTGQLVRQGGPGAWVYASPYKSWVYDSCVAGASIPSGVYTTSGQLLTPASGIVIDYIGGRVLSNANWGPFLTGAYAAKEVNVYFSSNEEIQYVMEQAYAVNPNVAYAFTGAKSRPLHAPLVMLTNDRQHNDPWALGGTDITRNTVTAMVISNDNWLQESICSVLADMAHSYIPYCTYADAPIGASGDLKSAPWSYCTGIRDRFGCNQLYIESVYATKVNERANRNSTFFVALVEFDTSFIRVGG